MPVSDDQVAAVRAYLQADKEEFGRIDAALDDSRDASVAYKAMIIATFATAVRRRFAGRSTRNEIIDYVAAVRSRREDMPDVLDAGAAERMITSIFTDESIRDIDSRMKMKIWTHFAAAIVNDAGLQGQELDDFLAEARKFANELLT